MATVIDLSHVQAAFIFLILVLLREPNVMRICVGSGLLPVSYRCLPLRTPLVPRAWEPRSFGGRYRYWWLRLCRPLSPA